MDSSAVPLVLQLLWAPRGATSRANKFVGRLPATLTSLCVVCCNGIFSPFSFFPSPDDSINLHLRTRYTFCVSVCVAQQEQEQLVLQHGFSCSLRNARIKKGKSFYNLIPAGLWMRKTSERRRRRRRERQRVGFSKRQENRIEVGYY